MPIKKIKVKDSDVFGSGATFKALPKGARGKMFGTATSMDFHVQELAERDENLEAVYRTGGHGNKYLPHPGKKVPLLTHHSCQSFSNFTKKEAGDLELNNAALKDNLLAGKSGATKAPLINMHDGGTVYFKEFGRDFGAQRRRDAKQPLHVPEKRGCAYPIICDSVFNSSTQDTFRSRGAFNRTELQLPTDKINKGDPKPDFYKTRQQVAHSKTAIGATAPAVCWHHGPRDRAQRGEQAVVDTFLEDFRTSLGRCQSAPHITLPLFCVGSEFAKTTR